MSLVDTPQEQARKIAVASAVQSALMALRSVELDDVDFDIVVAIARLEDHVSDSPEYVKLAAYVHRRSA